jgi:putative ABC transport system permease protein
MTFLDVLRTALSGISANKLRTGLTMLGIIIGVASVIATLALGNGARAAVENSFRFLGPDQIQVGAEIKVEDGESKPAGKLLTYEDGLTLAEAAPLIDRVEMTVRGTGKARHGQTTLDMPFTGVDAGALTGKIAGGKVQPVGWPAGHADHRGIPRPRPLFHPQ